MRGTLEERFWAKVDKNGPVVRPELGKCWVWIGSTCGRDRKKGRGYGQFWYGKLRKATHVAWRLEYGELLPDDKLACHHCDNPRCVRISHIYAGDNFTNQQDRVIRGRHNFANLTHCKRGHPFNGENLIVQGARRRCRICLRIRHANYTKRMNAKGYWKSGQSKGWVKKKGVN